MDDEWEKAFQELTTPIYGEFPSADDLFVEIDKKSASDTCEDCGNDHDEDDDDEELENLNVFDILRIAHLVSCSVGSLHAVIKNALQSPEYSISPDVLEILLDLREVALELITSVESEDIIVIIEEEEEEDTEEE